MDNLLDRFIADAILGIDTLWGGDVMNPSGTGRFIADSWFSDQELPAAYSHSTAAAVRAAGGLSADKPDLEAVDAYLEAVDLRGAVAGLKELGPKAGGTRGAYLAGLATCVEVMWDLAMEAMDRGDPVPYERSVRASTAALPTPSAPEAKRRILGELLAAGGYPADNEEQLQTAVDAWRSDRLVPPATIPALAEAFIAKLDAGSVAHLLPYLPEGLHAVPRANVEFMTIKDAWFSGSMNYVGRARNSDGSPLYEATYEINGSLEISVPEFHDLVSHEVVPGHVTTFAYLQYLYNRGELGFEATVVTMNSRFSTLAEGIANNAAMIAAGVRSFDELPDADVKIATLLAQLQDDAKNQASYLTWAEGMPQPEVAVALRRDFVVTEERAAKLSGPWAGHPILGRMYLPAYRTGTEEVARLIKEHLPEIILPALYGVRGIVDVATIHSVL